METHHTEKHPLGAIDENVEKLFPSDHKYENYS